MVESTWPQYLLDELCWLVNATSPKLKTSWEQFARSSLFRCLDANATSETLSLLTALQTPFTLKFLSQLTLLMYVAALKGPSHGAVLQKALSLIEDTPEEVGKTAEARSLLQATGVSMLHSASVKEFQGGLHAIRTMLKLQSDENLLLADLFQSGNFLKGFAARRPSKLESNSHISYYVILVIVMKHWL